MSRKYAEDIITFSTTGKRLDEWSSALFPDAEWARAFQWAFTIDTAGGGAGEDMLIAIEGGTMADTADRQPVATVQRWPNAEGEWYDCAVSDDGSGNLTVTLPIDIAAASGTPAYNISVYYRRAR